MNINIGKIKIHEYRLESIFILIVSAELWSFIPGFV